MAATTLRSDIRTEVRDNIQEASGITGAIWSDILLNRHIEREILSLAKKDIYLEQMWTQTLDPTVDYSSGITLPTGTEKVESVERNDGTSSYPSWTELKGVDNYNGAIFLPYKVLSSSEIRVKIKKVFTVPTDDVTALDVPDDICEVLVWGVTIRCYRILIGYLRGSISWDAVTKPSDVQITVIQNWLRDAKNEYQDLVKLYSFVPRPRDIDLTS